MKNATVMWGCVPTARCVVRYFVVYKALATYGAMTFDTVFCRQ